VLVVVEPPVSVFVVPPVVVMTTEPPVPVSVLVVEPPISVFVVVPELPPIVLVAVVLVAVELPLVPFATLDPPVELFTFVEVDVLPATPSSWSKHSWVVQPD
jgi:hypothetical protein